MARLRAEGCTVTTSESVLFELVGDAGRSEFKGEGPGKEGIAALVKRCKGATTEAVEKLCEGL